MCCLAAKIQEALATQPLSQMSGFSPFLSEDSRWLYSISSGLGFYFGNGSGGGGESCLFLLAIGIFNFILTATLGTLYIPRESNFASYG